MNVLEHSRFRTPPEKDSGIYTRLGLLRRSASFLTGSLCTMTVVNACSQSTGRIDALSALLSRKYDSTTASVLHGRIMKHYIDLNARKPYYEKWGMRFNAVNAVLALAVYRSFCESGFSREVSVEWAGELVWKTMPLWLFKCVFWSMGLFPDPFVAFVWFTKRQLNILFPEPGWKRNYTETEDCFGFDVTHCLYNDYCTDEGAPELVTGMCDLDYRIAELYPPEFYFKRTRCLAKGDPLCDFRYYRNERV
ncbi:MAG: L-2-amino-thiazoline-4-carboxylic acid hydrolase [Spirochaetes bacterium]|nr:L-2-amino-thiazoline-4-carboxylic acid hydrolase [Spirochaetota bacterium]